jgi:hypothetical protein
MRLLGDNLVETIKVVLATGGAALLLWSLALRVVGRPDAYKRLRDALLLALGLLGGACWWNLFEFHHEGTYFHVWDAYHYYVGAKYFRELGYTRLYRCTAIADAEDGFLEDVRQRQVRDLETNVLRGTQEILAEPEKCKEHFSEERWLGFKHDIDFFRSRAPSRLWADMQVDHGYNPTPVWGILGTTLASTGPASTSQLRVLALLDPLLLLVMWVCVGRVFGWRAMCVALLYWGTNYPGRFMWVGGAYLRQDWLAAMTIGLCLLRRGRMASTGFMLTPSALLRVFPAFILAGIALKALMEMWAGRKVALSARYRSLAVGCIAAVVVLVPTSVVVAGSWSAWPEFVANSRKYLDTPSTNFVGLKTVMAYNHDWRASRVVPLGLEQDRWQVWREARRRQFEERRYLFAALVFGFVILLALAVRKQEDWVAAVLGVAMIPAATEVACYYYSALLVYGLLGARREGLGAALCALAAVTGLIAKFVSSYDVRFFLISGAVVGFVYAAAASVAIWTRTRPFVGDQMAHRQHC